MATRLDALAVAALTGCASKPAPPRPPLTRIMVLPVAPPDRFWAYNNMVGGVIATSIANRVKSNLFSEKMEGERKLMGRKLTAALIEQLRAEGYDAVEWS